MAKKTLESLERELRDFAMTYPGLREKRLREIEAELEALGE